MSDALFWHRLQFAFTITFHYLFPQLTMGLALALVVLRWKELKGDALAGAAADFWTKIFGINFAVGVVTGIPMEFQFGTNWARFSHFAGGVIGQTLAMEGTFAFFLESTFLGIVLYAKDRVGKRAHFAATLALWLGSWASGYFIIATNAFMQHPVGYLIDAAGRLQLSSFSAFVLNPWALVEYAHNMCASVVTSAFVLCGVAAFWKLSGRKVEQVETTLRLGVILGVIASVLQIFPTGDLQGRMVARHQPAALAGMEGLFHGGPQADLAIIGQPNLDQQKLENPIVVPGVLSFLAYGSFGSTVKGLADFAPGERPDNVEVLYYAYHIMVGLGTLLLAAIALAAVWLWRGRLLDSRPVQWVLLLSMPFPYIATIAGWTTAEVGRQPWLIYGLFRTAQGSSPRVGAGDAIFTTLGFCGLYSVISMVFLYLVGKLIARGPVVPLAGSALQGELLPAHSA
jgi:cytochrome d ubiquinol oxidase subunit I